MKRTILKLIFYQKFHKTAQKNPFMQNIPVRTVKYEIVEFDNDTKNA
jgi:hypothetical protein